MRVRRGGIGTAAAVVCGTLLLTACGPGDDGAGRTPARIADAPAVIPVPHGAGSDVPDDFNGDGHRDLVLDDLVKEDSHADDAGIGVVYGGPHGLTPGARQLLTPGKRASRSGGRLPAVFDAEEGCDLDGDGFTDLIVSTDPPYDGQGRPPVPLQVLFGSPAGLSGRAVELTVPARARFGNDWPDQPVCGDFDGDGHKDLVLHASGGRLSYLRGPFSRTGAPRTAGAPLAAPGEVPAGPAADVDGDGADDLVVRATEGAGTAAVVLGGPAGPARTGTLLTAGVDVALGRFGRGRALDAAVGGTAETSLRYDLPAPATRAALPVSGSMPAAADFDGDGRDELVSSGSRLRVLRAGAAGLSGKGAVTVAPPGPGATRVLTAGDFDGDGRADLVVRTQLGGTKDTVAVYRGSAKHLLDGRPAVTFSTSAFLAM
ncbi:FG-GAP repeat domain-containing protein [Streptomyces sp. NPDC048720]|uniref:FG-GAP repeat domain-containing protein n=1 Tax=Streptomyces sp. NPDC048720 TaxID=3365588 RepID=UPI00371B3F15